MITGVKHVELLVLYRLSYLLCLVIQNEPTQIKFGTENVRHNFPAPPTEITQKWIYISAEIRPRFSALNKSTELCSETVRFLYTPKLSRSTKYHNSSLQITRNICRFPCHCGVVFFINFYIRTVMRKVERYTNGRNNERNYRIFKTKWIWFDHLICEIVFIKIL